MAVHRQVNLLVFDCSIIFGLVWMPMQEQVLALFADLMSSFFLTPSSIPKYETCWVFFLLFCKKLPSEFLDKFKV